MTSGYSKSLNEGRNLSSPALKELIEIELISWSDNRFQNFGIRLLKKLKRSLQFFTISLVNSPLFIPSLLLFALCSRTIGFMYQFTLSRRCMSLNCCIRSPLTLRFDSVLRSRIVQRSK